MFPYLIAGAIGFVVAKIFEDDEAPKYADGGLIAPNGKPSNLTPEQYKLVRKPEFKAWFGDWENDPANASKVVDENGEPLMVFHGSKVVNIQIFNTKLGTKTKSKMQLLFGTHFAQIIIDAEIYSKEKGKIYETFLSIKNPIDLSVGYVNRDDKNFQNYYSLVNDLKLAKNNKNVFDYDLFTDSGDYGGKSKHIQRIFITQNKLDQLSPKNVRDYLIKNNFDGVIYTPYQPVGLNQISNFSKSFIALYPEQIKLADGTNTTFDGNNPDIRFDEGGRVSNYREFYDNLQIEDGSKYIGQKFANVFPYIGKRTSPSQIRISVKEYNNLLGRLENDNYTTKGIKTADLNRLEKRQKYIDKKKYLSRFYLNPSGTIIGFDNSDNTYADGGLIAPNGKPSNLTPEQYKLVRTNEFKAWFGDWENDPETSSKVVDENKEPLIVYHGTDANFYEFEKQQTGWETFWFVPNRATAKMYAQQNNKVGKVFQCFLNVRNTSKKYPFNVNDYDGFIDYKIEMDYFTFKQIKTIQVIQVVKSNQIKLADGTNTTFDGKNPDIRFDEGGKIREIDIDVDAIRVSDEIGYFDDFVFNELEEDEILEGFVIKYYHTKEIGLVNVQDDKFELGVGYIWGLQVFEEYKGKGFGKKIIEKIFILHTTQYAFRGTATKKSKGFWLNLGAEFDESDEYSFILSKDKLNYSDGGSVLLAPNGKPSNLTPEQYKLVRTPAFKKWFGDWENDRENSGKVSGITKEPVVFYHSTKSNFLSKKGENIFKNPPFFFSFKKDVSNYIVRIQHQNKKGRVYTKPFFLKYHNTFDLRQVKILKDKELTRLIKKHTFYQTESDIRLFEIKLSLSKFSSNTWFLTENEDFQEYIKNKGYDSFVVYEDGDKNIAVFNPNRIKLADGTNTTFDGENADIRYAGGGIIADNIFDYLKEKGFAPLGKGFWGKSNCKIKIDFSNVLYQEKGDNRVWVSPIEYSDYKKAFIILEFYCKDKNKGIGTALLKEIIQGADLFGYTIFIEPTSMKKYRVETDINTNDLKEWYSKYDFKPLNDNYSDYVWLRNPKNSDISFMAGG